MARQFSYISVSTHPFLDFENQPLFASRATALLGRAILHGRRIDEAAVDFLGFHQEIERMFAVLPYSRIFTAVEPCFEELITEFYASFEFHGSYVDFQLGGVLRHMTMQEFGRALGIWTEEEQATEVYLNALTDFPEDISVYWRHISRNNSPFIQFRAKATGIQPVLRYLHAILAYTITGRSDSQGNVNTTDAGILSHLYRGIPVDLTFIFARLARDYVATTRKKSLGLGPFITRVARYFNINTSQLTQCSESTIPLDFTILRNMRMIKKVGRHYVVVEPPTDAPEDHIPEEDPERNEPVHAPTPIRRVRRRPAEDEPEEASTSSIPTGRNAVERYLISTMARHTELLEDMSSRLSRTERNVQVMMRHLHISQDSPDTFITPPRSPEE